ncbi:MAG: MBL fold metallo-hydrolase [Acidobacteria bacterium]|nr:MBL fold metallo-hydrolase [Acidobacteriota bacterium]
MEQITPDTGLIDLQFQDRALAIASAAIETPAGVLIVDPGPSTCRARLLSELAGAGISPTAVHGLLLTHIHLDHAGASGTLVREHPRWKVYVHERGAPHLIDPSRLLASATRLYGDQMDRLWGEFAAVPAANVTALKGGERLAFGARQIDVEVLRGHATHHVGYFDRTSGIAYAGDTAGIRTADDPYVYPPTPPPDIDLEQWRETVGLMRRWEPTGIFITHFGYKRDPVAHLDALDTEIEYWGRFSRELLATGRDRETLGREFVDGIVARITAMIGADRAAAYISAAPLNHCWAGLVRYWEKRGTAS